MRIWERVVPLILGIGKQMGTAAGVGALRRHREKKDGRCWARDAADDRPAADNGAAAGPDEVDTANVVDMNGAEDKGASKWSAVRARLSGSSVPGPGVVP